MNVYAKRYSATNCEIRHRMSDFWYNENMEFYHLMGRGVEKRAIVMDDKDRTRFIHDLFTFNDQSPALHPHQTERSEGRTKRNLLVCIHAYCLMKNHYHLLVSEVVERGISLFMKKLNMGYTKYFNEKYHRSGALWQGKHKRVGIERDAHFLYIPYYIHLNPLDYKKPEWRTGDVRDPRSALAYLEKYRWSSHLDYLGIHNFPSVIHQNELRPLLGTRDSYEREITNIITNPSLAGGGNAIEYPS